MKCHQLGGFCLANFNFLTNLNLKLGEKLAISIFTLFINLFFQLRYELPQKQTHSTHGGGHPMSSTLQKQLQRVNICRVLRRWNQFK
jgi:hypothetical protein